MKTSDTLFIDSYSEATNAATKTDWSEPVLTEPASLTLILVLAGFSIFYVTGLMVLIISRSEMQPLKIKSPRLMLLSIFANLFIIISVSVI